MANFGLMALATLMASFLASYAHCADTGHNDAPSKALPALEQEKIDTYMTSTCSQAALSYSPATSVHALRPSDIAVVSAIGMPLTQRTEAFTVVSRLLELLSMFNPEVSSLPWDQKASRQHRSLLEEAEALASSLVQPRAGERDWRLVLLLVPVEALCVCPQQVTKEVDTAVQQVEAALQVLHQKLHHSLVHVVVWSGHPQMEMSCRCVRDYSKGKLQLLRANVIKMMQDTLEKRLTGLRWASEDDDFTVMLQPIPLVLEHLSSLDEGKLSDSNQIAIQLWTNLLQPMMGQDKVKDNSIIHVPCPNQEHPFLRTQRNSGIHNQQAGQAFLKTGAEDSAFIDPVMGSELPCKDRAPSPSTPTSVHEVRPGDVKVVAALGDSLTAANGVGAKADNLLLVMNEYRGLSWDIGGDENLTTVTTLPNILREFNPLLTGYSQGIGDEMSPQAFLNQAVPGATSSDMTNQVQVLVDKMKNDMRIDYKNDWKVITMFIGGNDLCDFCSDAILFSTNNYVGRIQEALDILHREVPLAIVNLVEPLDLVALRELHKDKSLGCPTWFVNLLCRCVMKPVDGSLELQKLKDLNKDYQLGLRQLVDSGRYDTHTNFSVVLQPFFREVILPLLEDGRPDRSYFSPDCFHLSQKAHTLMAIALWNNMLEPVGNKTYTQDFSSGIDLKCPSTSSPYLRTAQNSNYTYPPPPPVVPPVTNWGSEFSCMDTAPSNAVPTSVHKLKPGDIKVVAALGDSLTAGFGAKATNLIQLSTEYRGVAWSIGGDKALDTVTTLPNILKKFNPDIKGVSKGQGKRQTGFNVAVSGAKIAGIPGQVTRLIDTMKNDTTVDFQNDWKLVTLFIGGNDLCQYCNDRNEMNADKASFVWRKLAALSPKNYSRYMMESLDLLYKEVPRVMVNVLEVLQIEGLRRVKRESLGCSLLQKNVCPCFLIPGEDSLELAEIKRINRELQTETENLVNGARYSGREDFTVVLQPFFQNSVVPVNAEGKADSTYFSVDCFHFSERGHADMAVALWNNMLEPVGEKQTYNNFTNDRNRIKCPTAEHPYIFTSVNSVPSVPVTTTTINPTTTTVAPVPVTTAIPFNPTCSDNVPAWAAAVLAVTGLLIGWGITWFIFSWRERKNKRKMESVIEMKGTGF